MKHILLIDDNTIDNYINKLIVMESKIADSITVMDSGVDALEFLNNLIGNNEPFPELIFLDIQKPEMDGFEFLDEFDKFPEDKKERCTINLLSSSKDPSDIRRAEEYTCVKNFFSKPMKAEMLKNIK
jgi:CheY-like chemotaxis protein